MAKIGTDAATTPLEMIRAEGSHFFKQKPRGMCTSFLGCEDEHEFGIGAATNWTHNGTDTLYLTEQKTCCQGGMQLTLSQGGKKGGEPLAKFFRPYYNLPICPLKACLHQKMKVMDKSGAQIGAVTETMYCCVPTFKISLNDAVIYELHQPTMCCGICVNYFDACGQPGRNCCFCYDPVPYYFYPVSGNEFQRDGKILATKLRGCLGYPSACCNGCTQADSFELVAPKEAMGNKLSLIYGATALVAFTL
ncbi:hypothetical protein T492DRAFT_833713 [Pavlovales sp. CCMP2436]|nr:hypothetical protein T492DRAFT_833713 [Pavlovales sp. CCMP2436]